VQLLKKILLKFDGLNYRQEYLCLGKESFSDPLHVYLIRSGLPVKDITNLHCFIGYSPLVFAIDQEHFGESSEIMELIFSQEPLPLQKPFSASAVLAFLRLEKTGSYRSIQFYEGKQASHQFTNSFHQKIGNTINHYYNRKPGNVFLDKELYKQVQTAYSVPRKISLITVGEDDFYNLFPTDLHGQPCEGFYIISLRQEGWACKQVIQSGKLVLSEMPAKAYKTVYSLGKNHMQPLKPAESFPFSPVLSSHFRLPLAESALAYKELELEHSYIHGIHRIMVFRIVYQALVQYMGPDPMTWFSEGEQDSLAHIHNVYATWRDKNGFQSNFLLR
jgi:flavin reductase (DIM6/NTAB) family NADH-FMN oxidoreductase RutF